MGWNVSALDHDYLQGRRLSSSEQNLELGFQTGPRAHPITYAMDTGQSCLGGKAAGT
jgi:hypothetical protein